MMACIRMWSLMGRERQVVVADGSVELRSRDARLGWMTAM